MLHGDCLDAVTINLQVHDAGVVADLDAQISRGLVVVVDQRFAAAEEETIGTVQVERAGQRLLPAHAMLCHPRHDAHRLVHGHAGEVRVV